MWPIIAQRDPLAFIWAGDAIYADIHVGQDWSHFPPHPIHDPATPSRLRHIYTQQLNHEGYKEFLNGNATIFGTVDDHDYGQNNGDGTFVYKNQSALEFLRFTGQYYNSNDVMVQRAKHGNGVYGVKVFDFDQQQNGHLLLSDQDANIDPDVIGYDIPIQEKEIKEQRVAIFVLDVRSNRTPWGEGFDKWKRNYQGDFLGETQWKWFESALKNSDADVNIIVNGIQVHPFRHPNSNVAEQWAQFPSSRQRLYDIIVTSGAKSPILVTGDVHMSQIMRKDCWMRGSEHGSLTAIQPLIEFTTSGLTHSWNSVFASSAKFHHTWKYYPMHILSKCLMTVLHLIEPMPDLLNSNRHVENDNDLYENGGAEGARKGKQFALDKNFGEIEIDWERRKVTLRTFGEVNLDEQAPPLLSASFSIDQLSGETLMPGSIKNITTLQDQGGWLLDGNVVPNSKVICLNYSGVRSNFALLSSGIMMTLLLFFLIFGPQIIIIHLVWKFIKVITCKKKSKVE